MIDTLETLIEKMATYLFSEFDVKIWDEVDETVKRFYRDHAYELLAMTDEYRRNTRAAS